VSRGHVTKMCFPPAIFSKIAPDHSVCTIFWRVDSTSSAMLPASAALAMADSLLGCCGVALALDFRGVSSPRTDSTYSIALPPQASTSSTS